MTAEKLNNKRDTYEALSARLCEVANFTPRTPADFLRLEAAVEFLLTAEENGNSGGLGGAVEVLNRRPNSRKTTVARQGKTDATFRLDGRLVGYESKVNGGRVDGIKERFVVYTLSVHNSLGNRDISPRIMRTEDFLEALHRFNAVKEVRHGGKVDGLAVQASSRKLWAWLEEQLEFSHDWDYYSEDFGG